MSRSEPLHLDRLIQQLPEQMQVAEVPGLVLTVIAENRVAATHAFGIKSTASAEPVAPDTVFQAASLSKSVFAYGVLQLWVDGILDLDRPLSSYLSLADADYEPQLQQITAPLPNNMIPNAAGSMLTTAPEYAQFILQMFDSAPEQLGRPAGRIRRAMLTPQVQLSSVLSWGLGWGIERSGDQTYFWHWGENGLFENFALGDSERGNGLVILTNAGGGLQLCDLIVEAITGHTLAAFAWLLHGKL